MVNALTGQDTLTIDFLPIVDMPDGDTITITSEGNIANGIVGKNKNLIVAKDETGNLATVVVRLIKGSPNDRWLHARYKTYELDPASYIFMTGIYAKRLGDGQGNVINDSYKLSAGYFMKKPVDTKENVSGDAQQAVTAYTLGFITDRSIG